MKIPKLLNNLRKQIKHVQILKPFDNRKISLWVFFKNGRGISIQQGNEFLYCGEGTYEIAPLKNRRAELFNFGSPELTQLGILNDQVLGHVTPEQLKKISRQISNYK